MEKKNIIDKLFPAKYDFYQLLSDQAKNNALGIEALYAWLNNGSQNEMEALIDFVRKADETRMVLEKNLIEAFATPFDRGDIYYISIKMDKVIEYVRSTMLSMQAFEVPPNDIIINMMEKLKNGADVFFEALQKLEHTPLKVEQDITKMRFFHASVEHLYREGMISVFKSHDPMYAIKQREIYHHIKDASANLDDAVNVLHRIVVRLT